MVVLRQKTKDKRQKTSDKKTGMLAQQIHHTEDMVYVCQLADGMGHAVAERRICGSAEQNLFGERER